MPDGQRESGAGSGADGRADSTSRLAMISRVTDRLVKTLDFEEALQNLIDGATELLEVERGSIMLLNEADQTLTIRVARGIEPRVVESTCVGVGFGIAGTVAATGKPQILWDVRQLPARLRGDKTSWISEYKDHSGLCVPLAIHRKVLGVMNFNNKKAGTPFDESDLEFAMLIANQAAIALYAALLHEEFQEKLIIDKELEIAEAIQEGFLPREMPELEGFDVAARCLMCSQIGGDYCGFIPLDGDRLAIAVGDVEGHGVGPALLMANARAALYTSVKRGDSIAATLEQVNDLLTEGPGPARLMTLLLGILDRRTSTFRYASAGHPAPLLLGAAAEESPRPGVAPAPLVSDGRNLPLGFEAGRRFEEEAVFELEAGDLLVLLTDGILEATDERGAELGPAGLAEILAGLDHRPAGASLEAALDRVGRFRDSFEPLDDYTLVLVKKL